MTKKILPPTYLLIAILAMIVLHFIFPLLRIIRLPWNILGLVPLLLGIIVNVLADKALHLANTTVKPFQESSALVMDGVYGISRHPMYLGFGMILIGVAVLLGTLSPWVIVPIFVALMEIVFIQVEERMLATTFGPTWQEYKTKVGRWI